MNGIELQILYTLQELHTPLVDGSMVFIISLGDHGRFRLLMGVLLFSFSRARLLGGCMLISIAAGFLLSNVLLENMAARQRPCWLDPSVELLACVPKDFSFPSGHSLVSLEGAACIFLFNRKWGISALMLVVLIALSRLYFLAHFPMDVLAGIIMGTIIAWSVVRTAKKWTERADRVPRALRYGGRLINKNDHRMTERKTGGSHVGTRSGNS